MPDRLFAIEQNPVPEGAAADRLTTPDGVGVRYARFAATATPHRGTVVVLPGRNECIEKYFETVGDLSRRGFDAVTLDWRGQGGSDRLIRDPERGYVSRFDDYVSDLEQLFKEVVLPDCRPPYYVLAHSTGALIALLAAPGMANRVRRMVLCAPLIELVGLPFSMRSLCRISGLLMAVGLGTVYVAGRARRGRQSPFAGNRLTSDETRYARNQALIQAYPELGIGGPTAAWLSAACKAVERICEPDFAARIRMPILFIAAGADEVVSTPAIERYARGLRAASVLTIDGARHEILQEADIYREQLLAAFDAFIPGTQDTPGEPQVTF